jgi:hypothetical protein
MIQDSTGGAQLKASSTDGLRFLNGAAITEWARFDSSGNFVVGLTSLQEQVEVGSATGGRIAVSDTAATGSRRSMVLQAPYSGQDYARIYSTMYGTGAKKLAIQDNGANTGFGGTTAPTAKVHIAAGTATAGTAPLKLTAGTVLTTTEAGTLEFNSADLGLYFSPANASPRSLLTHHGRDYIYSSGSPYSLTATPGLLAFGVNGPSITIIDGPGTFRIAGYVNLLYNGATFAANRTVTLKFRRTNNTAADLVDSTRTFTTGIVTTWTETFVTPSWEVMYTTVNNDDNVEIWGDVSVVPTAGSLDAVDAYIIADRLY